MGLRTTGIGRVAAAEAQSRNKAFGRILEGQYICKMIEHGFLTHDKGSLGKQKLIQMCEWQGLNMCTLGAYGFTVDWEKVPVGWCETILKLRNYGCLVPTEVETRIETGKIKAKLFDGLSNGPNTSPIVHENPEIAAIIAKLREINEVAKDETASPAPKMSAWPYPKDGALHYGNFGPNRNDFEDMLDRLAA